MKRYEKILSATLMLVLTLVLVGAITADNITYRLYSDDISVTKTSIELAEELGMTIDYVIETDDGFDIIGVKDRQLHILYVIDVPELEYNLEKVTSNEVMYYLKQMHLNIPTVFKK